MNWRSVLLGLIGVVLICGITPYNDYALNNTFLVGNNLPIGVVMLTFLFVVLVNGPLNVLAPRHAFNAGEITVAFSMTLISCGLPSSGLMRYFPNSLVMPFYLARSHEQFAWSFFQMDLADWLWPSFLGRDIYDWRSDPILTGYEGRWYADGQPPPYSAWITPALAWAVFIFALYGAMLCMVTLVRRQWYENERLPFPLAQIHLALIEEPAKGKWLNSVLSAHGFWVSFTLVFALHLWNGLGKYHPNFFATIPVSYQLQGLFDGTENLGYVDFKMKNNAVFFTVVGVTYFLTSSVAFSLWACFVLQQVFRVGLGAATGDSIIYGQGDQHFGGILAYAVVVLWIGRKHWGLILSQAFRGPREGEPEGRYLSYRAAFWGLVTCVGVMSGWMTFAGVDILTAVISTLLLLLLFFIITRIIAETGIVHGQLQAPLYRPWQLVAQLGPAAWGKPITMESYYMVTLLNGQHYDFREPVSVYASHGVKVADTAIYNDRPEEPGDERRTGRRFLVAMGIALVVAYFVSFASTLWTEYRFGWTQDVEAKMPINDWGSYGMPRWMIIESTMQYETGYYTSPHNPVLHFGLGIGITSLLSFLRLRFTNWPLHPVGYLMLGTFPGVHLWFSIFVGWLLKTAVVRWGGSSFYQRAKPFFFGLIVGESLAAGFWLVMGLVLNAMGIAYRPVNIMPG